MLINRQATDAVSSTELLLHCAPLLMLWFVCVTKRSFDAAWCVAKAL
jgi:hypothetical protein